MPPHDDRPTGLLDCAADSEAIPLQSVNTFRQQLSWNRGMGQSTQEEMRNSEFEILNSASPSTRVSPSRWLHRLLSSGLARYYGVMFAAGGLGLLKGVFYAKILGSQAFGFYALCVLIATNLTYVIQSAVYPGLECRLAPLHGAKRSIEAEKLRNLGAGLYLIASVLVVFALLIASPWISTDDSRGSMAIALAGLLGAGTSFLNLGLQDLRSRCLSVQFAGAVFARTALNLGLGLFAAHWFGFAGVVAVEALVALFLFVAVVRHFSSNFRFEFHQFSKLRSIFKIGLPILLRNLANDLSLNLDRWCVVGVFGLAMWGQYSFALLMFSAGMMLHAAVWSHLGPRVAHVYGNTGNARAMLVHIHKHTVVIALFAVCGWFAFVPGIHFAIAGWFPEYALAGELLPILYWGAAFQVLCLYDWIPMTLQRTLPLLMVTLVGGMVVGSLYATAIWLAWPMQVFAWIFVIGRALTASGQLLVATQLVRHDRPQIESKGNASHANNETGKREAA